MSRNNSRNGSRSIPDAETVWPSFGLVWASRALQEDLRPFLVEPGLFSNRRNRLLQRLEISEISSVLIVSMSSVGETFAIYVHHIAVVERPHDLADRVCLTDIRQNLLPRPCPRWRRAQFQQCRSSPSPEGSAHYQRSPPTWRGVGRERHHPNIGFNRGEGVVGSQHRCG